MKINQTNRFHSILIKWNRFVWFIFTILCEMCIRDRDKDTLNQFLAIARVLRRKIYRVQMPQAVILALDSTLLDAYGRQQPDFVSLYPYLSLSLMHIFLDHSSHKITVINRIKAMVLLNISLFLFITCLFI